MKITIYIMTFNTLYQCCLFNVRTIKQKESSVLAYWQPNSLIYTITTTKKKSRMSFYVLYAPFGTLKAYAMMFILKEI